MSERVEKLIEAYPQMLREQKCLTHQLAHFRGFTASEVIDSMYMPRQDGERVQTSGISDKTAQIALNYRDRMEQMNREWYAHLERKLVCLTDEIAFFESALRSLSGELPVIMWDLVVEAMTWDAVADLHHMSRANIGRLRKRAISELDELYREHDREAAAYMLE